MLILLTSLAAGFDGRKCSTAACMARADDYTVIRRHLEYSFLNDEKPMVGSRQWKIVSNDVVLRNSDSLRRGVRRHARMFELRGQDRSKVIIHEDGLVESPVDELVILDFKEKSPGVLALKT